MSWLQIAARTNDTLWGESNTLLLNSKIAGGLRGHGTHMTSFQCDNMMLVLHKGVLCCCRQYAVYQVSCPKLFRLSDAYMRQKSNHWSAPIHYLNQWSKLFNLTLRNKQILIEIHIFSFKKMYLKMSSAKWRPLCLGLNVLITAVWQFSYPDHWSAEFTAVEVSTWETKYNTFNGCDSWPNWS